MSLDGLRAWIGEVERKLAMRTRVFLVLVAIAIGGAGAGIYLGIESNDDGATTEEVQALEERIDALGAGTAATSLESRLTRLELQLTKLRAERETASGPGKGDGGSTAEEVPEIEAE
jgi:hypothetical protein